MHDCLTGPVRAARQCNPFLNQMEGNCHSSSSWSPSPQDRITKPLILPLLHWLHWRWGMILHDRNGRHRRS